MIQVKPYKPQKIDNMTKASDLEKPKRTLDDYARVAGIQPKRNPLEPYAKLWREQQAGGTVGTTPGSAMPKPANYVGNAKPRTAAQMAAVSAEGGIPEYTPGSSLSAPKRAVGGSNGGEIRTGGLSGSGNVGNAGLGQSAGPRQTQPKADPWQGYREAYEKSMALKTSPAAPAANYGPLQPYAKAAGLVPDTTAQEEMPLRSNNQNWNANARNASQKPASERPILTAPGTGLLLEYPEESDPDDSITEASDEAKTKSYIDPYTEAYQGLLNDLNKQYGGDFLSFDPSELTGEDWDIYDEYNTRLKSLGLSKDQYLAAQAEAERQKNIQAQQAFINSELTKKYLPIYLKQAGMGGLGVSQSTLAQLANDYQNTISNVNSQYDSTSRELLQKYLDAYNQSKLQMDTNVNSFKKNKREREIAENREYVNAAFSKYDSEDELTGDQIRSLEELLKENQDVLDKIKKEEYTQLLNSWKLKTKQTETLNKWRPLESQLSNNEYVMRNLISNLFNGTGNTYEIKKLREANKNILNQALNDNLISREVYDNKYRQYVSAYNGY